MASFSWKFNEKHWKNISGEGHGNARDTQSIHIYYQNPSSSVQTSVSLMSMAFIEFKVKPTVLRFSQDTIASFLPTPWDEEVPLLKVLNELKSGELSPDDLPPMEVSIDEDGVLWSNDNRRLWLFRKAGISQITVKLFSKRLYRAPPRNQADRALMSKSDFFPKIRGQRQVTGLMSTHLMDHDTETVLTGEVVKVNPNAVRYSRNSVAEYMISTRSDRDQDLRSNSDSFPWIRGQSHETTSTSTQLMEDNSHALLTGAVATASALVTGFAGWKLYKQSRE